MSELSQSQAFLQQLEAEMEQLSQPERERLFRRCAVNCVKDAVLTEQRRQFEECGRDLDAQYAKYGHSEFFFAKILEPGKRYEIGYPRCLCGVAAGGFAVSPVHCECSRQSILYVLHELQPEKKFTVRTIETVLGGAEKCRFLVELQ